MVYTLMSCHGNHRMDWSGNILGPDSMAALAFLQDSNSVAHLNLSNCQLLLEMVSHMIPLVAYV